ncbi:RagB/SusD family nutrient uptake outer membrane protein [Belliella sp. DSM 111904]|uniref:RagB/SusD family nutrient uptake outer membrane protein n=1 Tax=Belliella filtrata TaxID=2923435 RepID=A0ABS9V1Z3_9BACT|nr:RagB/SusD family nutrient uptake outer membrane protein [Belliella filtrata]MCH7410431.1 RagB/SusD family nutrient uptake outer membrane protein [Belliella filtrata]
MKKSIYNNIKYFAILTGTFLSVSCTDFLEERNESNYTQENYFQTPEHAEAAINHLYSALRFVSDGAGTYGESPFMSLEFPTGLVNTEVGQSQFNNTLRNLTTNSENNYFNVWWEQSYRAIANANLAIDRIPSIQMNETTQQNLIAEAHFMRAFHYFNLVRLFGDIPLITVPVDADSDLLYPSRSPIADIYDLIVSDLQIAEESNLPASTTNGRVSQGAIKATLAQVYLTMAGYPLQAGDNYYALAAEKAKEVIDQNTYSLFATYDELRDPSMQLSGEIIFKNQYLIGFATSGMTAWLLPRSRNISQFSDEFGVMYPTAAFINTHEEGDARVAERGFYYTSYPNINNPAQEVSFGAHYIYKYFDEEAVLNTAQSDLGFTFIRYADVLLTFAEAEFEANGATTDALEAINAIRNRANLAPFDASSLTREAIWKERFHELAFENKTWFDMIRRRQVLNLASGNFEDFAGHSFSYGPTLSEKYLLFAIPQREIDNNNQLTQNPEW